MSEELAPDGRYIKSNLSNEATGLSAYDVPVFSRGNCVASGHHLFHLRFGLAPARIIAFWCLLRMFGGVVMMAVSISQSSTSCQVRKGPAADERRAAIACASVRACANVIASAMADICCFCQVTGCVPRTIVPNGSVPVRNPSSPAKTAVSTGTGAVLMLTGLRTMLLMTKLAGAGLRITLEIGCVGVGRNRLRSYQPIVVTNSEKTSRSACVIKAGKSRSGVSACLLGILLSCRPFAGLPSASGRRRSTIWAATAIVGTGLGRVYSTLIAAPSWNIMPARRRWSALMDMSNWLRLRSEAASRILRTK